MALLSAEDNPPRLKGDCPDCDGIPDGALTTSDAGACVVEDVVGGSAFEVFAGEGCVTLDEGVTTSCAYIGTQIQIDKKKYIEFMLTKSF